MTIDQLRIIACAVRQIGGKDEFARGVQLDVGYDGAITRRLLAIGGRPRQQVYPPDTCHLTHYAIESASLLVDGVTFHAQWSRPATPDEIASERAREETAARAESHGDGELHG